MRAASRTRNVTTMGGRVCVLFDVVVAEVLLARFFEEEADGGAGSASSVPYTPTNANK